MDSDHALSMCRVQPINTALAKPNPLAAEKEEDR